MKKILLIGLIFISGCTRSGESGSAKMAVEKGPVSLRVSLSGSLRAERTTSVSMPYSGYVRKIYVKVGDKVKAGDPLVSFSQSLGSSEALFPVRASYPGLVTQVFRSEGDYINTTDKERLILRLDDLSKVFVALDVPEAEMGRLKEGMKAQVRINALPERTWEGTLARVFRAARDRESSWDRSGGVFPVSVEIKEPNEQMMPGLSAVVDILAKDIPDAIRIRQEYLQRDDQGSFVWIGTEKRRVKVGLRTDEFVEIQEGLQVGENIEFRPPSAKQGPM